MKSGPLSTDLGDDAGSAYQHFRREARTLGSISRSFDILALSTTAAYLAALRQPADATWTALVAQTALLVDRVNALAGIVVFGAREREALDFFTAIVRENADLLPVSASMRSCVPLQAALSGD